MTAAVYRWWVAHVETLTGQDALVWVGVIVGVSLFVGMALVGLWSMIAEPVKCRAAQIRSRLARWHAAQVRAANTPTRFEDRK